jgi:mono/diheme cytochrome c family protein
MMPVPWIPRVSDRANRAQASARMLLLCCALLPVARAAAQAPRESPETVVDAASTSAQTAPSAGSESEAKSPPPGAAEPIDFFADIQPIFTTHCIRCHGPQRRSGGLRLDALEYARQGGDSAEQIVGGTLDTNELYRRVSSSDRSYRMPKNAPPLSPEQIQLVKRWVEQGAVWPELTGKAVPAPSLYERALGWIDRMAGRYEKEYEYLQPYALAFVAVQVVLLVVSRAKGAHRKGRAWASGRLGRFCAKITSRELGLVWLLSLAAVAIAAMRGHQLRLDADIAKLQGVKAETTSNWTHTVFGYPPVPVRPDHPKQLAGTYYRGNCERNEALFNGGNYLTATFHVSLRNGKDEAVNVGDPADKLFVRLEIERAPGTTDMLFTGDMMASVFLSEQLYETENSQLRDEPVRLDTLEDGRRWVARVPLGKPDDKGRLEGLIYVYTGRIEADTARGDAQYAIKYDLHVVDGRIDKESDVWMGSFTNPAIAMPEPPDKIPYREWFDHRPMPTITGENTKDPKLLGVDEYVKKKLIKPQPAPPPKQ